MKTQAPTTATAAEIAAALTTQAGTHWKAEDANGGHAFLVRSGDGLKLWLSAASWHSDKRLHCSLSLPNECPTLYKDGGKLTAGEIGISPQKSADEIARDIVRRMMPMAEIVYTAAVERIALEKKMRADRVAAMEAVAKASGGKAKYEWGGSVIGGAPDLTRPKFTVSVGGNSSLWDRHGYGEMRINQGLNPSVEITLNSVPLSVALQISEFLRDNVYKLSA